MENKQQVLTNKPEFMTTLLYTTSREEMRQLLEKEGIIPQEEELEQIYLLIMKRQKDNIELTEEELDAVNGGWNWKDISENSILKRITTLLFSFVVAKI